MRSRNSTTNTRWPATPHPVWYISLQANWCQIARCLREPNCWSLQFQSGHGGQWRTMKCNLIRRWRFITMICHRIAHRYHVLRAWNQALKEHEGSNWGNSCKQIVEYSKLKKNWFGLRKRMESFSMMDSWFKPGCGTKAWDESAKLDSRQGVVRKKPTKHGSPLSPIVWG